MSWIPPIKDQVRACNRLEKLYPISITAIDQVNHTVEAIVRSSLASSASGLGEGQLIQKVIGNLYRLNFHYILSK